MSTADTPDSPAGGREAPGETIAPTPAAKLPAVLPPEASGRRRRRWPKGALLLLVLLAGGIGGGGYWWLHSGPPVPPGIAFGNGRLEADEIDIATKFAGRVAKLAADEGDMVKAGQIVAAMDTRDLEASLKKAEALASQAERTLDEARANLEQQQSQARLAQQELDRTAALVPRGYATAELLDQRRQQRDAAIAAQKAAAERVGAAEHALHAASQDVELYRINIADNTLVAPRDGRIQYRVANVGEVLAAGGRVFTMLDTAYVYMDIYLPTAGAGRVRLGSDARIVLDAYPDHPIPAKVAFIATQAQFTPKTVETRDERDKLMFRVRVRIDPDRLRDRAELVRSGLPGVGYVRTDPAVAWPARLEGKAAS
ncbi:MAG TPA: HlyD family efflux transporter periplasmic adaptor subunit [Stellaceae bacterium]|jgi:HlyD family secretion protein|nr:HlyD family efflux transporter periplasmic adaptor subunit [Stellaceae bacterium]